MPRDLVEETGKNIPLSEMIQSLRDELLVAMATKDDRIPILVESAELELKVEISKKTDGSGGFNFGVLSGSGKHERSDKVVHTFKLKLKPFADKKELKELLVSKKSKGLPTR